MSGSHTPPAAKSPRALASLRPFLRPYRQRIAMAFVFLVLAAITTLVLPIALRTLIDQGMVSADPGQRVMALRSHFLALFGVGAALGVFSASRYFVVTWLGERITADIKRAVYAHVLRQSPEFFETTQSGEVLSRLTADATLIQTVVGTSVSMGLRNAIMALGALVMLIVTNPFVMAQVLGGLGALSRGSTAAVVSQYNIQPMVNVFAATQGRDLGGVATDIQKALKKLEKDKPAKVRVTLRGQFQTMNTAFSGMGWGLLGAVVMIYLLIVINFQSWLDPFVIISALPAALAGIAWMLFATGTPLSVPALTGAIMCMGVATANSILVVSFARERLAATGDAVRAAFEAGVTRFRPVLMTALAMIIGMIPMALGLGEGGEQNAPLGRAVIGGLVFATVSTLLFVPVLFAGVHQWREKRRARTAAIAAAIRPSAGVA